MDRQFCRMVHLLLLYLNNVRNNIVFLIGEFLRSTMFFPLAESNGVHRFYPLDKVVPRAPEPEAAAQPGESHLSIDGEPLQEGEGGEGDLQGPVSFDDIFK